VREAHCGGLQVLFSDGVPAEAEVVLRLVARQPAAAPPEAWARAVVGNAARRLPGGAAEALTLVEQTPLDAEHPLHALGRHLPRSESTESIVMVGRPDEQTSLFFARQPTRFRGSMVPRGKGRGTAQHSRNAGWIQEATVLNALVVVCEGALVHRPLAQDDVVVMAVCCRFRRDRPSVTG
jgi:hypothetical protein